MDNAAISVIPTAHPAVSFDEVEAAATSLQDDGQRVTIAAVRDLLGAGSPHAIHKHLAAWRAGRAVPAAAAAPQLEVPESIAAALSSWVQQVAEEAGSPMRDALAQSESDMEALLASGEQLEAERQELLDQVAGVAAARDQALSAAAEHLAEIERLTVELRDARRIATDALVGKAKDQLAIDGKDRQLADLRQQLERNLATSATESDARLAAEMELVGAVTARDNFASELTSLRAQLDTSCAERAALRTEVEALRAASKAGATA